MFRKVPIQYKAWFNAIRQKFPRKCVDLDSHDHFNLTTAYRTLLLAVLLDSHIVENLIMLITSTKSRQIAAQAGFLLAEIDSLSGIAQNGLVYDVITDL